MVAIPILEESQQLETDILNSKCEKLVAHTGFGPVISSLRGRCPRPLDECAVYNYNPKLTSNRTPPRIFETGLHLGCQKRRPKAPPY
jgi:hypothetical protein